MRCSTSLGRGLLLAGLLTGCTRTDPPVMPYDYTNGEDVVRAMHDRYVTRWLTNVTYVRQAPGRPDELIAIDPPDRMRIDIDPKERGNGLLNLRDTAYVLQAGRVAETYRFVPADVLLQHAVYWYTPPQTIARLKELGFDLARVREERWQDRQVFVVGSAPREFWVDRQQMLLVRLILPSRVGTSDTRFTQYERIGPAWIAKRSEQHVGGNVVRSELRQIGANLNLDSLLFVPGEWTRARHWYQTPLRERR